MTAVVSVNFSQISANLLWLRVIPDDELMMQPEILSERFQKQETVTLGEALFLIDQVSGVYVVCCLLYVVCCDYKK